MEETLGFSSGSDEPKDFITHNLLLEDQFSKMCGFETNRIVSLGAIFEVALTANQDIRRDICFSSQIPADVGIIEALLAGIIGNHDKQIPVTVLSVGSFRAASKEPNGIRLNIFLNLIDKRLNWSEVNWVQLNLMKRRGLRPLFLRN